MVWTRNDGDVVAHMHPDRYQVTLNHEWVFPRYLGLRCVRCGNPKPDERRLNTCGHCDDCTGFNSVRYLGLYNKTRLDDLKKCIIKFKYKNKIFFGKVFGLALSLLIENEPPVISDQAVIVPVPCHPEEHPEREYHPPDILAKYLHTYTGIPIRSNIIAKYIPHEQISTLNATERIKGVTGVYGSIGQLDGDQVILLDDIMSAGGTVTECSRLCLYAGASSVDVVVLGRNELIGAST